MENSKVYWCDMRTGAYGDSLTVKLQKLIKKASAPDPAAIQQQIDYIHSKIK